MMQMHVFVSGAEKQFHLTFTDMAKNFQGDDFQAAWQTMSTLDIFGDAPVRYQNEFFIGAGVTALFIVFAILIRLRRKAAEKSYQQVSDSIYTDDEEPAPITQSHVWNLKKDQTEESHYPSKISSYPVTSTSY